MYSLSTFTLINGRVSFDICIVEVISQIKSKSNDLNLLNLLRDKYKENDLVLFKELEIFILEILNVYIPSIINEITAIEIMLGNQFDNYCDLFIENELTNNEFWIADTFTLGNIFPKTYSLEKLQDSFHTYITTLQNL